MKKESALELQDAEKFFNQTTLKKILDGCLEYDAVDAIRRKTDWITKIEHPEYLNDVLDIALLAKIHGKDIERLVMCYERFRHGEDDSKWIGWVAYADDVIKIFKLEGYYYAALPFGKWSENIFLEPRMVIEEITQGNCIHEGMYLGGKISKNALSMLLDDVATMDVVDSRNRFKVALAEYLYEQ